VRQPAPRRPAAPSPPPLRLPPNPTLPAANPFRFPCRAFRADSNGGLQPPCARARAPAGPRPRGRRRGASRRAAPRRGERPRWNPLCVITRTRNSTSVRCCYLAPVRSEPRTHEGRTKLASWKVEEEKERKGKKKGKLTYVRADLHVFVGKR